MEKSQSQKKRNNPSNKDSDDGSRKAEKRPKIDFKDHEIASDGSKLTSTSESKNEPKKEKVRDNKKEVTDAKQGKNQVKEEPKVKERMIKEKVKREQKATEDHKGGQKAKEEHKGGEKLTKQQKQEKVEKERANKDIKEEEKAKEANTEEEKKEVVKMVKHHHKDEVTVMGTYEDKEPKPKTDKKEKVRDEIRKEEKEEERKDKKDEESKDGKEEDGKEEHEEKKEEEKEEERKELRDDAPPTVKRQVDDEPKDIIEMHPILVGILTSKSSPLKDPKHSTTVSASSPPEGGIPKRPLAAASKSVSPPRSRNVNREISPPASARRPDSPPFPEERNVCVLSPRKNTPEDPLPRARIPGSGLLPDVCDPCRFSPRKNIAVEGAMARQINVCRRSREPHNKVGPGFDQMDRPPPSDRPAPRDASKSPSAKKSKDRSPSPKKET